MASKYLGREDAPFEGEIWSKLDEIVIGAAKAQISGRKLLEIEGPFGLGLKSVPLADVAAIDAEVKLSASRVLPIALLETTFILGERDLAAFEETGYALDTQEVAGAAMAMAAMEDTLVFEGNKGLGIEGLTNAKGAASISLGKWEEVGTAANDCIKAVTTLDAAGFHGPYLLALAPDLYNMLYRLYPQGYLFEMQHVESIVEGKVIKAPGIKKGGVLLAASKQFASIVVGQDMSLGFVGPAGPDFEFKIVESLSPRIRVPSAVCALKA